MMDSAPTAAVFLRIVFAALLWSVLACSSAFGLDLRPDTVVEDGVVVMNFSATDFEGSKMISFLDSGGTLRFTWQLRADGRQAAVTRFGRRDALGEGYFILDADGEPLAGPFSGETFLSEITVLRGGPLEESLPLEDKSVMEGRLVIDRHPLTTPLERKNLLGIDEERSPWRRVRMPEEGSE